ncbi:hypothetical protein [Clostridium grantii]|uniref:Uncharacterized protein n=1 Tax=Clostridium grantii DSM 8605 TaxID=1121316 RepID=A0A1M5T598_9CLOT|nr:hypothetical protein [Clostridium grantii]SHH45770.1 hypothetical protein SAMN02745207_01202 [Clostridium grantii DSM 8605]
MKVIAKPIEMMVWFDSEGVANPVRFKLNLKDEQYRVIKIHSVIERNKERLAGNDMLKFTCESLIDNCLKVYEIKYEISTCKWILFKY